MSSPPAMVGLVPAPIPDIPIAAVFLALFIPLAAAHMTIFQLNRKRGIFFPFNAMIFGFGMSRILANIFRIAWSERNANVDIQLVATIFLNAGILIVYIVNNLLAWRMVRSAWPQLGWHPVLRTLNKALLWIVLPMIVTLIVIIVTSVKAPHAAHIQEASSVTQKIAQTYFLFIAATPLVLLPIALIRGKHARADEFGQGSWRVKALILTLSTALAITEAGFRCGTVWAAPRPATDPAWYHSRAAFYCFNFVIDVCLMTLFLVGRIDRRFFVPNKASGPGAYSEMQEKPLVPSDGVIEP